MVGVTLGLAGIAAVTVLLALSAFFSSSETAIFSLPAEWFEQQAATDDPRRARPQGALRRSPPAAGDAARRKQRRQHRDLEYRDRAGRELPPSGAAVAVATVCTSFLVLVFGDRPQGVRPRKRRAVVAADRVADPTGRARPLAADHAVRRHHASDERVHQRRREHREAVHGLTRTEPSRSFDRRSVEVDARPRRPEILSPCRDPGHERRSSRARRSGTTPPRSTPEKRHSVRGRRDVPRRSDRDAGDDHQRRGRRADPVPERRDPRRRAQRGQSRSRSRRPLLARRDPRNAGLPPHL